MEKDISNLKGELSETNAKLQTEQQKVTRYERERSALSKKLKFIEGQAIEDAFHVGSFQMQLSGVDAWIKEARLQAIVDLKKFAEYMSKLKQVFVKGSKFFQDKCGEAGLDLAPVNKLIMRNFGSGSSSKVTYASGARDDQRELTLRSTSQPQRMEPL